MIAFWTVYGDRHGRNFVLSESPHLECSTFDTYDEGRIRKAIIGTMVPFELLGRTGLRTPSVKL